MNMEDCREFERTNEPSVEDSNTVIIDTGSFTTKAGFANDNVPRCVVRSIVGRVKQGALMVGPFDSNKVYVGDDAYRKRGILQMKYPIQHGMIQSNRWDDIEKLWQHISNNELNTKLSDADNVLLTQKKTQIQSLHYESWHKKQNAKMMEIMFEKVNVSSLYIGCQSVLSLETINR